MKDFFGKEITVGAYLFYAVRAGNVADVRVGKVVGVTEGSVKLATAQKYYKLVDGEVKEIPSDKVTKVSFWNTDRSTIIPKTLALSYAPILKYV